jgi:hypothetical protein
MKGICRAERLLARVRPRSSDLRPQRDQASSEGELTQKASSVEAERLPDSELKHILGGLILDP